MRLTVSRTLLLIALATVLAYANALRNDFVWDDEVLVKNNDYIRNTTYIAPAFVTDLSRTGHSSATYYRPLQTISYMLDYRLWGLNPAGYHLTNLLLHLTCALLVWALAEKLTHRRPLALCVALLFAVHPVNTSAVTYVAGRADMLAFAGILGSLLCFIETQNNPRFRTACLAGAIICFIAALFSRENAMLLPALLLLYCFVMKHRFRDAIPFLLVLAAFIVWRTAVLHIEDRPLLASWGISLTDRIQIMFRALATYFGLLLWPAHLQMDRQLVHGGIWLHVLTATGIIIATGLALALRRSQPVVRFGIAWFIVTLLPVSGVLSLTAAVAEHWLYVPAVGLYLAFVVWISQLRLNPRILTAASIIIIAALGLRTAVRNTDWANGITIYRATAAAAPDSLRVRNNIGLALTEEGNYRQALTELLAAERTNPADPQIKANLAVTYQLLGDIENATRKNAECLRLDPRNVSNLLRIAYLYELRGNFRRAHDHFMAALAISRDVRLRLVFAQFLFQHHRYNEAIRAVQDAADIDPGNAEVFTTLGTILTKCGRYRLATEALQMAHDLDPNADEIVIN